MGIFFKNPHPAKVLQRKAPHPATLWPRQAPHAAREPPATKQPLHAARALTILRSSRDHLDDSHISTVWVPTMETYEQHVEQRVSHFIWTFGAAVILYRRYVPGGALPLLFTDHAAVQEGSGFRLDTGKYDAAHLMNTSLIISRFSGLPLSIDDQAKLDSLYRSSGATTNQFQRANVSADKLIDAVQTDINHAMTKDINAGTKVDEAFAAKWFDIFVLEAQNRLAIKCGGGIGAASVSTLPYYLAAQNAIARAAINRDRWLSMIVTEWKYT